MINFYVICPSFCLHINSYNEFRMVRSIYFSTLVNEYKFDCYLSRYLKSQSCLKTNWWELRKRIKYGITNITKRRILNFTLQIFVAFKLCPRFSKHENPHYHINNYRFTKTSPNIALNISNKRQSMEYVIQYLQLPTKSIKSTVIIWSPSSYLYYLDMIYYTFYLWFNEL